MTEGEKRLFGVRELVGVHNRRAKKVGATGSFTPDEWIALCENFLWLCVGCGYAGDLGPDHIVPLSKGGTNTIDNIQPMCRSCNSAKRMQTIDLRVTPFLGRGWYQRWKAGRLNLNDPLANVGIEV